MERNVRLLALELGLVTAIALTLGWPGRAWAPNCPGGCMKTTKLIIPLAGEVTAGADQVALAGSLQILTRVQVGPSATTIDLYANLSDVLGEGFPSGAMYEGTGAVQMRFTPPPPFSRTPSASRSP